MNIALSDFQVQVLWSLLLAVCLALILGFGFHFARAAKQGKGISTILLVGPSGAGKTSLYLEWTGAHARGTVVSMRPNVSVNPQFLDGCRLADLPGHEKLLYWWDDYLTEFPFIKEIIFMVDAASGSDTIKGLAGRLYSVLQTAERRQINVMIALNKFDLFSALSPTKIRSLLEEGLEEIRSAKMKSIGDSNEEIDPSDNFLGLDGEKFKFDHLETSVSIIEGSVKSRRTGKWEQWVKDNINN